LIEHYCSGTICWNTGIVVSNLRLNTKVRLPESVTVYPWELRKIRNILLDQYYIALMVVNGVTSELAEALPIRPFSYVPVGPTGARGKEGITLYPLSELGSAMGSD